MAAYAETLLAISERFRSIQPQPAMLGLCHPHVRLEQRVAGLLDPRRNVMVRMHRVAMGLVVGVFAAAAVTVAGTRLLRAEPPAATPAATPAAKARQATPPEKPGEECATAATAAGEVGPTSARRSPAARLPGDARAVRSAAGRPSDARIVRARPSPAIGGPAAGTEVSVCPAACELGSPSRMVRGQQTSQGFPAEDGPVHARIGPGGRLSGHRTAGCRRVGESRYDRSGMGNHREDFE